MITGLDQVNGFYENIRLTDVETKEDIYSFFQGVTNIIDQGQLIADWYPHWIFRHKASVDWYVFLFNDGLRCEQFNGEANVGLSSIPYGEIECISCDLFIDGSTLAGIWITLKNGVEIRLI